MYKLTKNDIARLERLRDWLFHRGDTEDAIALEKLLKNQKEI